MFRTVALALVAASVAVNAQQSARPAVRNAISGRATGPDGKPITDAVITLVVRGTGPRAEQFHPADVRLRVTPDLTGQYRIENAPLGEHLVVAIPRNAVLSTDKQINRTGYGVTCHPSARSVANAKPVMVNVREVRIADIVMQPVPLSVVSGTVIGSNGEPAPNARIRIARSNWCAAAGEAISEWSAETLATRFRLNLWRSLPSTTRPRSSACR